MRLKKLNIIPTLFNKMIFLVNMPIPIIGCLPTLSFLLPKRWVSLFFVIMAENDNISCGKYDFFIYAIFMEI